jgi:hypothetical protein
MKEQIARGKIEMFNRRNARYYYRRRKSENMQETVLQEKLKDILHMQLLLASGGYGNVFFFYTAIDGSNVTAS